MIVSMTNKAVKLFVCALNFLTPIGDLVARWWIAYIFLAAGWVKIQSWSTTISLFTYEYHAPILSPYIAALLGTATEIILPVLLIVGFGGRFCILLFFAYNAVAMVSYPFLWTPGGDAGLQQQVLWGLLLMMLALHGSGKLSLDHWLHLRHQKQLKTHAH